MPVVTGATKTLLQRVLAWDIARVEAVGARGQDVSVYRARQAAAAAMLDFPVEAWPDEIRDLFMTVLEVTRAPMPLPEWNVLRRRPAMSRLSALTRPAVEAHKRAAEEIGVLNRLRATAPEHWR